MSRGQAPDMRPVEHFHFCPRCGGARTEGVVEPFKCGSCGFVYYFNPTVAAAALLVDSHGRALFIRRAREPAKGKLAMPGGFIDAGERAEDGLRREIREEVNLELASIEYLCSQLNSYHFGDVTYPVLDLFFVAKAVSSENAAALDAVESYAWLEPARVDLEELAFPSMREALEVYLRLGT
jgi:ADP-ribose pyrophosphatase YjhB (NUDIX family)